MQTEAKTPFINQQLRIFSLLWVAYAGYYLCRLNFAVAQPAILKSFPTWTSAQIGFIPSLYSGCYAAGQIINGTIGQKLGARFMMTAAMVIIALVNFSFSQVSSYYGMLILWGLNGYTQSAGWSLMVDTMSRWSPPQKRATVIGLLSTCYQVGNVLAWLLAGYLCEAVGWRAAFMVPSFILLPIAGLFGLFMRNSPEEGQTEKVSDSPDEKQLDTRFTQILILTVTNKILWLLGLSYFCLNTVRFTFLNWSVQYLTDFHGINIKGSAWIAVVIPLIGSAGALSAGWASDRLFHKRSAPVCTIMLISLAVICLFFNQLQQGDLVLAGLFLGLAGFMIYGPDMLLAGTAGLEFSHSKARVTAIGFIMSLGNIGGILAGVGIGFLRDLAQGRWELVFSVLSGLSLVSAFFTAGGLWMQGNRAKKQNS
jgi:sugar phosphate permease